MKTLPLQKKPFIIICIFKSLKKKSENAEETRKRGKLTRKSAEKGGLGRRHAHGRGACIAVAKAKGKEREKAINGNQSMRDRSKSQTQLPLVY